jgi:hypothetical protein
MRKRYKEGRNSALEQIINKQQQQIDLLENKVINRDFVIDAMSKESDQYVLTCKFLTDTLLMLGQLEKLLIRNNSVFLQPLLTAITSFHLELSKAMQTIQYDGGDSFTFDIDINDNNCVNDD